ncbi:MAG: WxcM-like domain-containing protein [Bacteroidales bacterium]|nr:WxcM-like domain-containing protein [Bacteroidales bacterium]
MIENIKIWDLDRKGDSRGWFLKVLNGSEEFRNQLIGDVYFVCGKDSGIRGNHFHIETNEWFSAIKGNCSLYLEDIVTHEKREIKLEEDFPKLVFVPKNVAHAFYSDSSNEFIVAAFTDTLFDPSDTIKFDLV